MVADSQEELDELEAKLHDIEEQQQRVNEVLDKYSYEEMLFSFKPLIATVWYTKEERELLGL